MSDREKVLEEALHKIISVAFLGCQPDQGDLFGQIDDIATAALASPGTVRVTPGDFAHLKGVMDVAEKATQRAEEIERRLFSEPVPDFEPAPTAPIPVALEGCRDWDASSEVQPAAADRSEDAAKMLAWIEAAGPDNVPAAEGHYERSLCVECGPDVDVDEDGCCATCGATAVGNWLDENPTISVRQVEEAIEEEKHFCTDYPQEGKHTWMVPVDRLCSVLGLSSEGREGRT